MEIKDLWYVMTCWLVNFWATYLLFDLGSHPARLESIAALLWRSEICHCMIPVVPSDTHCLSQCHACHWCPYLATALSNHITHICKGAVCSRHRSFCPLVWCWTCISSQLSRELVLCPAVSHLRYRSQLQGSDWSHCVWGPWLLWTCWIWCAYQLCIQALWQR
jgi:hypothetical protein